jgi:PAS domain S-box-containing protein
LEGKLTYSNQHGFNSTGYTQEDIDKGLNASQLFIPEERERAIKNMGRILRGEKFDDHEYTALRKDGSSYPVIIFSESIIQKEKPIGLRGIVVDISDRKKMEDSLRMSEEKYRTLFTTSPEAIVVVGLDGTITECNEVAENIGGFQREDIIGKNFSELDIFDEEGLEKALDSFQKMITNGGHEPFELAIEIDGKEQLIEIIPSFLKKYSEIFAIQIIVRDITERKKVEGAIRESEEKFRNLSEKSPNMIFINKKGTVVYANEKCTEIMGYTKDEFYSPDFDFRTLIAPENLDLIANNLQKHMIGEEVAPYEYTILTKEGLRVEAIITTKLIKYEGEPAILGIITDLSELKKTKKALMESEEKYRDLVENINDVIYALDGKGNVKYVSPTIEHVIGYKPNELIGKPFTDFLNEDDISDAKKRVQEIKSGIIKPSEYRIKTKSGEIRWINASSKPLISNGEVKGLRGVLTNIDERKKTERALSESEERYRTLFKASPASITLLNKSGEVIDCNNATEKLIGYSKNEIIGTQFQELLTLDPKDLPVILEKFHLLSKGHQIEPYELEIIRKEGKRCWITVINSALIKDDAIVGFQVISRDITDRKRYEKYLKKSAQQWQSTFDAMTDSVCILDIDSKIMRCNKTLEKLTGKTHDELIGLKCHEAIHNTTEHIEDCPIIRAKQSAHRETLVVPMDDKWYNVLVDPILDKSGNITGVVHIMEDITEQKLLENELTNSLEEKEVLFRELKHRIKNNLQMLASMVQLQIMRSDNDLVAKKLEEVHSVIDTMGLIYTKAFDGTSLMKLNLNNFIHELIAGLMKFKLEKDQRIDYSIEGDDIQLVTDQAIPLALITNEIIFNSLKHAFMGIKEGKISVVLKENENTISMEVSDNGIGLSVIKDINKPNCLGLTLIKNLTEQLGGQSEIISENGTKFTIEIPKRGVK